MDPLTVATVAAQYVPAAVNIIRGLRKPEKVKPIRMSDRSVQALQSLDTRVDTEPALREARRALSTTLASPGLSTNQKLYAYTSALQQRSQILAQAAQMEQDRKNQKAAMVSEAMGRVDQYNAGAQERAREINAQNRAARDNLLATGFSQLSGAFQGQMADRQARESDVMGLGMALANLTGEDRQDFLRDFLPYAPRYLQRRFGYGITPSPEVTVPPVGRITPPPVSVQPYRAAFNRMPS